jgi:hypothetical protein
MAHLHLTLQQLDLRMHHEEAPHGFIGRVLNISQLTLRAYPAEYQQGGIRYPNHHLQKT